MSQELERVYTINLGKALLSQSQHRAVRAINMIREFARHHMKVEEIKIEEELSHQIWAKGVRSPPRKIRVRMSKTDEGYVLVSRYDEKVESKVTPDKETKKVEDKVEPVLEETKVEDLVVEPVIETKKVGDTVEKPAKEAPKKEAPKKEAPKKEAPKKEAPKKEAPKK
ncbi:MAG TPA: 50S ribosomal protein L31, partial [Nitrosopumilus sp.]|nr:50S ribosomal protein L31 [Nitrosopumilus sp.]